jgi:hypothetical protein
LKLAAVLPAVQVVWEVQEQMLTKLQLQAIA